MDVEGLANFIKERERVRKNKESGKPGPWTADPILGKFRFCNVHREDDRVTRWLRASYYPAFEGNRDLWFAAVVARLLNLPESLEAVKRDILPFRPAAFNSKLDWRRDNDMRNFNAAYIVSTNGRQMDKAEYITYVVLHPMWEARKELRPFKDIYLSEYHGILMKFNGMGSFIAAQVVADLKHIPECPLSTAYDHVTFAASGPGSRRGMNRVMGRLVNTTWPESLWRDELAHLRIAVNKALKKSGIWVDAQDLQNCLCEYDKYERARLGEGTPKQLYTRRS